MDNRVYNLKGLNNRLETLEQDKEYIIKAVYTDNETAEATKTNITIEWLKQVAEFNAEAEDGTHLERFRIYDRTDCLISFNVHVLDKLKEYNGNYNQDLRRFARPNKAAEKKLARTQFLIEPTLKAAFRKKAALYGQSMNYAVNELIRQYVG